MKIRCSYDGDPRDIVKLKVEYYPYDRYSSTGLKRATVSGEGLRYALANMVDHMLLYLDSDQIYDEDMTADEIIQSIESSNGDGCDYIISLINLNTGETLIEAPDDYDDEDWDDWED